MLACGAAVAGGCGGGEATGETEASAKQERLYPAVKGPTREFFIRGGDNVVQLFGREATKAEREQASEVISAWMKARAAQDWAKDCSYFSRRYVRLLVAEDATKVTKGKVKNCPQALAYFGHEASGSYKNNLSGPIDSLRVSKGLGYAQYHGNDGHDWVISMNRENGRWLVAIASPLGRSR
ncbi:MAG TPA: hypothetical protein VG448_07900 [Solirubrobacterales bacterium]|nr:hypothetical protein [Solirubrobacterales bacterium]